MERGVLTFVETALLLEPTLKLWPTASAQASAARGRQKADATDLHGLFPELSNPGTPEPRNPGFSINYLILQNN